MIVMQNAKNFQLLPQWTGFALVYSPKCGHCGTVMPIINKFNEQYGHLYHIIMFSVEDPADGIFMRNYFEKVLKRPFIGVPDFFRFEGGKVSSPSPTFNRTNFASYLDLVSGR